MANHLPVRPVSGAVAIIPPVAVKTVIMAVGGNLLLSSDAIMDRGSAIHLQAGQALEMPAGVTWLCACESGQGAEIRRMDLA